jgi:competence protein ComEA
MKKFRILLRALFGFSRREGNALIVLIIISAISILLPVFVKLLDEHDTSQKEEFLEWYHSVSRSVQKQEAIPTSIQRKKVPFDPNFASERSLIELGFRPFIARRIVKFREAGGLFTSPNDLLKVYGVDSSLVMELSPMVVIRHEKRNPMTKKRDFRQRVQPPPPKKSEPFRRIDLNLASDTAFQAIRGIGPVLSKRIVKYREALGGFVEEEQLKEVYGLPDSLFDDLNSRFELLTVKVAKRNINSDSLGHLASHPYIDWKTARIIENYRKMHGEFEHIEELKNIHVINDSIFERLRPYLSTKGPE